MSYNYGRIQELSRYIYDGNLQIDNNLAENAIRPITVSRKNFLLSKAFDNKYYPKYPIIQSGDNIMPIIQ